MSAGFWLVFWIAVMTAFLNVLYGMWLLRRFGETAKSALAPRTPTAVRHGVKATPKPSATSDADRHERFNQVRREAVAAALKDFGRLVRSTNPYHAGSAAHTTWASHYERVMHDQFTLEVARVDADTLESA